MRIMKNIHTYLIILGVLIFAAGSARAGGVVEEWVARYNGPANIYDDARAIALDAAGNIYVTGSTDSTYAGTFQDYATVKYDANGSELWVSRYDGPANDRDSAHAIAVDAAGNIYVTGTSTGSGTSSDYATIKYDPNGSELWVSRYNGPANGYDYANAIALDAAGNIYVTGGSGGSGTYDDYATIKYDPNGSELWVSRYNGPANGHDRARAIVLDAAGNIYVTGESDGGGITEYDYATVKYDPNGSELWARRYDGPTNEYDSASAIAVDAAGNIYVTGGSYDSGTYNDYATVKYDPNGSELWISRYNGPANDYDAPRAIAVDVAGNIYVTGESYGSSTMSDYATVKYDPNGSELWVSRYDGPANGLDDASAIAVDAAGNIYVTGGSDGGGITYDDYATVKYDPNGSELWVSRYNGPANDYDDASAIAVDVAGNIYVTGGTYSSGTGRDYATVKYVQCLSPISGDLNDDCKVDFVDIAILTSNWLECNWSAPEACW